MRPAKPPSTARGLARVTGRTRNVERRFTPGGYIHYNDELGPNVGDYLTIEATGPGVGLFWGAAIEIVASAAGDAQGGVYVADYGVGGLTLNEVGSGQMLLVADSPSAGIKLENDSTQTDANLILEATHKAVSLKARAVGATPAVTPTAASVFLEADDQINLFSFGTGINIDSLGGAGIVINASSNATVTYPGSAPRPVIVKSEGDGTNDPTVLVGIDPGDSFYVFRNDTLAEILSVSTAGVEMKTLPSSNPGGTGRLWNNGGVVNIT